MKKLLRESILAMCVLALLSICAVSTMANPFSFGDDGGSKPKVSKKKRRRSSSAAKRKRAAEKKRAAARARKRAAAKKRARAREAAREEEALASEQAKLAAANQKASEEAAAAEAAAAEAAAAEAAALQAQANSVAPSPADSPFNFDSQPNQAKVKKKSARSHSAGDSTYRIFLGVETLIRNLTFRDLVNVSGGDPIEPHKFLPPVILPSLRLEWTPMAKKSGFASWLAVDGFFNWNPLIKSSFESEDSSVANSVFTTKVMHAGAGLSLRVPFSRHFVGIRAGYELNSVKLSPKSSTQSIQNSGVPGVSYNAVTASLVGRFRLHRYIMLGVSGDYYYPFTVGAIKSDEFFPNASAMGFGGRLNAYIRIVSFLDFVLGAQGTYFFHDFNPIPLDAKVVAGGANDMFLGMNAGLSFHF